MEEENEKLKERIDKIMALQKSKLLEAENAASVSTQKEQITNKFQEINNRIWQIEGEVNEQKNNDKSKALSFITNPHFSASVSHTECKEEDTDKIKNLHEQTNNKTEHNEKSQEGDVSINNLIQVALANDKDEVKV